LKKILPALLLLFIFCGSSKSQEHSNRRYQTLSFSTDTLVLDSLSIVPASLKIIIDFITLDSSDYWIDYNSARFVLKTKSVTPDSLKIQYRVFPYNLSKVFRHKDPALIGPDESGRINPFIFKPGEIKSDFFKTEGLNKSGSISRGITFGNNQDVVVNSNLNLQLSGKLNENVNILAAITDDNIPIQPEGNTQQLQEFDKVYIQLYDEKSKLTAGDFQLSKPNSHFLNYYKRAQGGSFSTIIPFESSPKKQAGTLTVSGSAAVSRGKFARNIIPGIEGNQGPYRLRGAENESFIIVLAGTEKIFLDGQLLQRGQDFDYVIDYNTAEIIFTPKILITKDKRITAEFQYSEKNYARSLVQFGNDYEQGKLKLRLHVFSEQDNKNKPLLQELSFEQKELLRSVGDSLNDAISPKVDSIAFDEKEILYLKKDTIIDSILFNDVYVFSTDPERAFFRLGFSNVGQNRGNYKQINTTANGKVFQWVAPVNGVSQGSYEPITLLITPKQKQMVVAGGDYAFNKESKLGLETAVSKNDLNTFSEYNSRNDVGAAVKLNFENVFHLNRSTSDNWTLATTTFYEHVNKNFSFIERYRSVEFERDWNRTSPNINNNQHLGSVGVMFTRKNIGSIKYQANTFIEEGNNYEGFKNQLFTDIQTPGILISGAGSLLQSKSPTFNSEFLRHKALVRKKIGPVYLGVKEEQERNMQRDIQTDTLLSGSFDYFEWQGFVSTGDSALNRYSLNYTQRRDYAARNNRFHESTLGESINLITELAKNPNSVLKINNTYRRLSISDSLLTFQKPDKSLLNRVEYNFRILKGFINSSVFYEFGSGLEVKKEFTYILVAAGQGVYTWKDYNNNNIAELNEFEVAVFRDQANYIKVYTPTNTYVKVYSNQFNEVLNINPAVLWGSATGFKKFISRFSNQTAYRVERKTNNSLIEIALNPFLNETQDTNLVTINSSLRNTFSFNRNSSVFGIDFNYQDNRNKSLLTNGFESRSNFTRGIKMRYAIIRELTLSTEYDEGKKESLSEFFVNRNYLVKHYSTEPKIIFQPSTSFRTSLLYRYTNKLNQIGESGEQAIHYKGGVELKYNVLSEGSLLVTGNYIYIKYNADPNTPLAFEMLDALKTGGNITWNVSYQRTLSNHMQLSFTYDGRKSEDVRTVHIGGVQVRAFF